MSQLRQRYVFATLLCVFSVTAQAQSPNYDPSKYPNMDAGALMRQAEQSYKAGSAQRSLSKLALIESPMTLPSGVTIRASEFKFLNANLLKNESLQDAVKAFANRDLSQSDLDNLCSSVADAYRQAGWVVRVYVPRQPLHTDSLTIQILETVPPSSPK